MTPVPDTVNPSPAEPTSPPSTPPSSPSLAARLPQGLAIAILLVAVAAAQVTWMARTGGMPAQAYVIFERLFLFNDHANAVAALVALVLMLVWPGAQQRVAALADAVSERPGRACAVAFVALGAVSWFVGHSHPLSMDEYAVVLQAHAFAHGDLTVHYDPRELDRLVYKPFQGWFILVNPASGDAMSAYWPGLALLMAPLALLHLEWLANPALTVMTAWLVGDLAVQAGGGPRARGWAMLAALASAQLVVNAASFYAMPALLAFNLLFLWLLLRPGAWSAFAAGLAGGFALVMHNPVPHALMALPCLGWLAWRRDGRRLGLVLLGYLPVALPLGMGWAMLGSAMGMAHTNVAPAGTGAGGLVQAWIAALGRLFRLPSQYLLEARYHATWKVWIWAAPGLALLAGIALARQRSTVLSLLAAAFGLTYAFYFLVPFDQGHGWGYRYVHPVWAVIPVGAAVWIARGDARARALGAALVAAGGLSLPVFMWQTESTIADFMSRRITAPAEGHWAVFVAPQGAYTNDIVQNLPDETRVRAYVGSTPDEDAAFMAALHPGARRELLDPRGSLWRLPETAPAR